MCLSGPINITKETYEIIPCENNIPSDRRADWLKWCRGQDPNLLNHHIIEDGVGSATVFNGHERQHDLLYTKANSYVSGQSVFLCSFFFLGGEGGQGRIFFFLFIFSWIELQV